MAYNVRPGDRAVIIDSVNGKRGLSVGRKVMVHADAPAKGDFDAKYSDHYNGLNDPVHYCPPSPYEKEHTVHGKIWPVTCLDGKPFANEMGGLVQYVDVPDKFLRKLPDVEPVATTDHSEELDLNETL
jgi:hypothetical protein